MVRRHAWLSLLAGLLFALPAAAVLVTRWEVLWAGHPAFPFALVIAVVLGVVLLVRGLIRRERRRSVPRTVVAWLVVVVAGLVGAVFWYLRPVPATDPSAAKSGTAQGVKVSSSDTRIVLTPVAGAQRVLVFYPGARIDPRSYAAILRPVAAAGTEVRIVKEPFNIAFFAASAAAGDLRNRPAGERAVAGHSLGGVVASQQAADLNAKLVLWASYPATSIAGSGIAATAVYGSEDGLATPSVVREAADKLPADAVFIQIEGANHGSFGDFEPLAGDGVEQGEHAKLKDQIAAATVAALK